MKSAPKREGRILTLWKKALALASLFAFIFSMLAPPYASARNMRTEVLPNFNYSNQSSKSNLKSQPEDFRSLPKKILTPEKFVSSLNDYSLKLEGLRESSQESETKIEAALVLDILKNRLFFTAPIEREGKEYILGAYQGDQHRVHFVLEYSPREHFYPSKVQNLKSEIKASMGTLRTASMLNLGQAALLVKSLPTLMVQGELSGVETDDSKIEQILVGRNKEFEASRDWRMENLISRSPKKTVWPESRIVPQFNRKGNLTFRKSKKLAGPRRSKVKHSVRRGALPRVLARASGDDIQSFDQTDVPMGKSGSESLGSPILKKLKGQGNAGANMDWVWKKWFPGLTEREYSLKRSWLVEEVGVYFFAAILVGLPIFVLSGLNLERALVSAYLASRALFIFGHLPVVAKRFGSEAPPKKLFDAIILTLINVALLYPAFSLPIYALFIASPITHLILNIARSLQSSILSREDRKEGDRDSAHLAQTESGTKIVYPVSGDITVGQGVSPRSKQKLNILTDIGMGDNSLWEEVVDRGWREGVDYHGLLFGKRGIILGDTNHGFLGVQRGFIEHLKELKDAGITHLFIEIGSDLNVENIEEIAERTRISHRFIQLVRQAQELGLEVVFMDMPKNEQQKYQNKDKCDYERGVYMGQFIDQYLSSHPEAQIAAITGFFHVEDFNQIPFQISHPVTIVAGVSEGQQGYDPLGLSLPLFTMAVVSAVLVKTNGASAYGTIDLMGEMDHIDGIIHYQRPYEEAPLAAKLQDFLTSSSEQATSIVLREGSLPMTFPEDTRLSIPTHRNYEDRVDPSVHTWAESNEQKIIDFVSNMDEINAGQKFYLAAMLLSYAQNNFRHNMGGSIVSMGFVPQGQFFEFKIIDTFNYAYDPTVNYGSLMQHKEISLKDLQRQFGFDDLLIEDIRSLPNISIANNPQNPASLLRFVLFILAVLKNPKRVVTTISDYMPVIAVLYSELEDTNRIPSLQSLNYITHLSLDDFMLTPLEEKLNQIKNLPSGLKSSLDTFKYIHAFENVREKWVGDARRAVFAPTLKNLAMRKIYKLLDSASEVINQKEFDYLYEKTVLNARRELRVLNPSEIEELAAVLDQILEATGQAILEADKLLKHYPDIAEKNHNCGGDAIPEHLRRGRLYGVVKVQDIYNQLKEQYEELKRLREAFNDTHSQLPPPPQAPSKKKLGKRWFGLLPVLLVSLMTSAMLTFGKAQPSDAAVLSPAPAVITLSKALLSDAVVLAPVPAVKLSGAMQSHGEVIWYFENHVTESTQGFIKQVESASKNHSEVFVVIESAPPQLQHLRQYLPNIKSIIDSPKKLNDPTIRRALEGILKAGWKGYEEGVAKARRGEAIGGDIRNNQALFDYFVRNPKIQVRGEKAPFESMLAGIRSELAMDRAMKALYDKKDEKLFLKEMAIYYLEFEKHISLRDQALAELVQKLKQDHPRVSILIRVGAGHSNASKLLGSRGKYKSLNLNPKSMLLEPYSPSRFRAYRKQINSTKSLPAAARKTCLAAIPFIAVYSFMLPDSYRGSLDYEAYKRLIQIFDRMKEADFIRLTQATQKYAPLFRRGAEVENIDEWYNHIYHFATAWLRENGFIPQDILDRFPSYMKTLGVSDIINRLRMTHPRRNEIKINKSEDSLANFPFPEEEGSKQQRLLALGSLASKKSGPAFILDPLQFVQLLRKNAYPLYLVLVLLVGPLLEEKIFRDLVIGGRDDTFGSFFFSDPIAIGSMLYVSIFLFSASHVIVKWIVDQSKPREKRIYSSFEDAVIDFLKYIFPSFIFTAVYILIFTFVPAFYFQGVYLDAYAMSTIAHSSYNAFILFLNSGFPDAFVLFLKSFKSRFVAETISEILESLLLFLRKWLPLAHILGAAHNGDSSVGDKSVIITKLSDGELQLDLDFWTITEIEELKNAKVKVHTEKGLDMDGDLIEYPTLIEFITPDKAHKPVKMIEVRNSKHQLVHIYREPKEIEPSYLADLSSQYGELTLLYYHLDKDGKFTATKESYLPIFRNRKKGEVEVQLDVFGKTKMIWHVEHKDNDPDSRSLTRLEPVYGNVRYLFPLELEFVNKLSQNLHEATYEEISDAHAKTIAWTLVRLQRKSLDFLKEEGLLKLSDLSSLEKLNFDPIDLADLAERLLQQIKTYEENGLNEWQIARLLSTKLVPWTTLAKWQKNYSLDLIFEALPHPNVESYLAQSIENPELVAEKTWGLFENRSRIPMTQEHRIWLVNIILAKYGIDHGMQIDQVMKSLSGNRVLYVGLENGAPANCVAEHLVKAGMGADSISPFAGTNGISTELFSKSDVLDIRKDSNQYDLIIAEPFFDEYFDVTAMKNIGYTKPRDYYLKAASEIMRVLKDDGKFLVMLSHKIRATEFRAAFKELGFVIKEIGSIGDYPLFEIIKSKIDEEQEDIFRRYRNRILDSYDVRSILVEISNLEYLVQGIKVEGHNYYSTYVLPLKEHLERVQRAIEKAQKNQMFNEIVSSFKIVFGNSPDVNISQSEGKLVKYMESLDLDLSISVAAYYKLILEHKFKVKQGDQEIERNFVDIDPYNLMKKQKDVWDQLVSLQIAEFHGLMVNPNVMLDQLEEKAKLILALQHLENHKKDKTIKVHYEAILRRVISRISLNSHALLDYLGLLSTLVPTYLQELLDSEDEDEFFELEKIIKEALEKLNVLFKQDWVNLSNEEIIAVFEELIKAIGHPRDLNSNINRLRGKLTKMNFMDKDNAEGLKRFIKYFLYPYYLVFMPNILNMQIQFLKKQGENSPETLDRVWQQFGERVEYMENDNYKYNETRNRFNDWWNGLTVVEVVQDEKKEEKPIKIPFRMAGGEKEFFITHEFLNEADLVKIANPIGLQRVLGEILKNCAEKNAFERQSWDARVNITFNRQRKKGKWGVEITIEDDGKGISSEMLAIDHLTGRQMIWNRGGTTGGKERGVGMSEAWKIIVEDSKGTIEADNGSRLRLPLFNEQGEIVSQGGARFTIWLPIVMNGNGITNKIKKKKIRRGKQRGNRRSTAARKNMSANQGGNITSEFENVSTAIIRAIDQGIVVLPGIDPRALIMPMVGGTLDLFGDSKDKATGLFDDIRNRWKDMDNKQEVSFGAQIPEWLKEAVKGDQARTAGNWKSAIESYQNALGLNPPVKEQGRLWVFLGLSYFNLADVDKSAYSEALTALKKAETLLLPDNPIQPAYVRVLLGDVYFEQVVEGREEVKKLIEDEAKTEFLSQAKEEESKKRKAKLEIEISRNLGRSINSYSWALKQPNLSEDHERRAVEYCARALMNLGLMEQAGNFLTFYLEKFTNGDTSNDTDKRNRIFYSLLGGNHAIFVYSLPEGAERAGRLEQAVECWEKAKFLDSENIYTMTDLIAAYLESGKEAESLELIKELIDFIFRVNSAKIQNESLQKFVAAFKGLMIGKEKFSLVLKEMALKSLELNANDQTRRRLVQIVMSLDAKISGFAPIEIRLESLRARFDFFNEKPKQRKEDQTIKDLIKGIESLKENPNQKVVDFLQEMFQTEIVKYSAALKKAMEDTLRIIEEALATQAAENETLRLKEAAERAEMARNAALEQRAQDEKAKRLLAQLLPNLWRLRIKALREAKAAEEKAKEREAKLKLEREQAEIQVLAEAKQVAEETKKREKEEEHKARTAAALKRHEERKLLLSRILDVLPDLRIREAAALGGALYNANWEENQIKNLLEGIRDKKLFSLLQIQDLIQQIKQGKTVAQIFPFDYMEELLKELLELIDEDTIYKKAKYMSDEIINLGISDPEVKMKLQDVYINAAAKYQTLERRIKRRFMIDEAFQVYYKFISSLGEPDVFALDPVALYPTERWDALLQIQRGRLAELLKTPQTDLKKAIGEFYVLLALDYLKTQIESGKLTLEVSRYLFEEFRRIDSVRKYTTDYEDIDLVNDIVGSAYGFLHVWLPIVLEREKKKKKPQSIKNAEPLVKSLEDYINFADQEKWSKDDNKNQELFHGIIQQIEDHLPAFLAEFKKLKVELTQDERNLFRFVEGEQGLKLLPKILALRISFLSEDKNQADQIKFDQSAKEEIVEQGGKWSFLQGLYDWLGLNWFGQALSPSLIESGLWVGGMTVLTHLILERIFGIPLEIGPPLFIILGFFQFTWHRLHGRGKAFKSDKLLITALSIIFLIPYSFLNPSGYFLLATLPILMVLPHLIVNSYYWHRKVHRLPKALLNFSFFQNGLWVDFSQGFQVMLLVLRPDVDGSRNVRIESQRYIDSLVDQYKSSSEIDLLHFFDRLERQLLKDLEHTEDSALIDDPHEIPWLIGKTVAIFLHLLYFERASNPTPLGAQQFSKLFLKLFIKQGVTVIDIPQILLGNVHPETVWLNPDASRSREIEWLNMAMVLESKKALEEALAMDNIKLETPLIPMANLSAKAGEGKMVFYKPEFLQPRKAFKIRAQAKAFVLFKMFKEGRDKIRKLVTASTGNHGLNTAYAVHLLKKLYPEETKNLFAEIYTSPSIKSVKMNAIQSQPYTRVVTQDDQGKEFSGYDQANAFVKLLEEKDKSKGQERTLLHIPHGDEFVVAGYATTGLEIFDQLERMGLLHKNIAVTVPMGSGGHAAGIAWVLKTLALMRGANIKIIGVQTEKVNAAHQSLRAGKVQEVPVESEHHLDEDQIAVAKPEEFAIQVLLKTLDASVIVKNEDLIRATRMVYDDLSNSSESELRGQRVEVTAGMNALAVETYPELFSDREVIIGIATGGNVSDELWQKIEARAPPTQSFKTIFSKIAITVKMKITLSVLLSMFLIPVLFFNSILLQSFSLSHAQTYREQSLQEHQDLKQSIGSLLKIKVTIKPSLTPVSFEKLDREEATFSMNPSIALALGKGDSPILTHAVEKRVKVNQALLGQSDSALQGISDVWFSPFTANQSGTELLFNSVRNSVAPEQSKQKNSTENQLKLLSNILGDRVYLQNNKIQEQNQRLVLNAGDCSSSIEEVRSFLEEMKEESMGQEKKKDSRKYEVVIVTDDLLKTKGEIEKILLNQGISLYEIKQQFRILTQPREKGKFNLRKLIRSHGLADGYSLRVLNKNGLWSLEGLMGKIWHEAFKENRIVFIENSLFGIKVVAYSQ
ncbi:MAG: pyridoxal-phosphate dependent enzyme [Elusimicrobia bacterium]|nr:pyridoxal-phosphate dependent enzyme [Elusimicrobiota bacterium]